jgi:uncharacterized Ntn-hydrolase superfamily protein
MIDALHPAAETFRDKLAGGASAEEALKKLCASALVSYRQLLLVDSEGRTAGYSGSGTLGVHAIAHGKNAVAGGNLLANADVPAAMMKAFEGKKGSLPERLLTALAAGFDAGGEAGPVHSAGLLVVREVEWPVADLRVDWSDSPISDLQNLWAVYRPQMEDYVRRALDPSAAPSFGVPGDQ